MAWRCISQLLVLIFITRVHSQFYNFFGVQPLEQNPRHFGNEYTTRRTKTIEVNPNPATSMTWKNTTISFSYDGIERDDTRTRNVSRGKKRRQPSVASVPTLLPIFNFYTSTQKTVRKTTRNNRENVQKKTPNRQQPSYDVEVSKNSHIGDVYDHPINKAGDDYVRPSNEATARPYNYHNNNNNYNENNNRVIYNTNDYTTKRAYYNRPGVKPIVVDDRPPITNKPVTQRPYRPVTQRPYKPETQRPYSPETQRPYKPETQRPTTRPYIVHSIPTQAGAVVFPHEEESPEVIKGPDEDYMSDVEKRRYIEMAEKMCDKYKSLNTKQLAAIPLLPSPEPVEVNVTQCTPTQIPLVVGGKVVTINEFPHMALLGWVKIDGGGYSWKCGGSLISDQHILTAAHCSYEERDNTVITGPPRVVQLGSSYLDDPGALVVRVAAIIRHPKYKFPKSYHDLAILKLVQPITFSEVIKPACLGVPPGVDQPIIATGWGKTEFGGDQSVELRSVSLPVWNMERCREILGTSRKMPQGAMRDSQLCAGEKRGGKDTCQGDSGGPAQLQDGCVWRVVAVTSLGRSCGAPNTPGLYALVQRAFVAAAVFGNHKNNQRRSDSSQPVNNNDYNRQNNNNDYNQQNNNNDYNQQNNNNDYNQQNNNNDYNRQNNNNDYGTTQGYQSDRRTTTTESYYNPPQNDYGRQNSNRRTTTTTESYYNPPQNDYGRQNINRRTTTTTESYYKPPQNDYGLQNNYNRPDSYNTNNNNGNGYSNTQNNRRVLDTDAGFYSPQRDSSGNQDYINQPQNDYRSGSGQPRNDYSRRHDDRYEPGTIWFT